MYNDQICLNSLQKETKNLKDVNAPQSGPIIFSGVFNQFFLLNSLSSLRVLSFYKFLLIVFTAFSSKLRCDIIQLNLKYYVLFPASIFTAGLFPDGLFTADLFLAGLLPADFSR